MNGGNESAFLSKFKETINAQMEFGFRPKNVCMICSNDSIIAGYLVADYTNECSDIPTTVTNDMRIPGWFDKKTLAIIMINEDKKEQLYRLVDKLRVTGCGMVIISDFDTSNIGGILYNLRITSDRKFEYLGETLGYLFMLFDRMDLVNREEITSLIPSLEDKRSKTIDAFKKIDFSNYSKKNFVISYPPNFRATAGLWKAVFFRRLKICTFMTEYPEYNHNEIVGWCMSPEQSKDYVNIFIVDENTDQLLSVITESMIDVLKNSGVEVSPVKIKGKDNLEKNMIGFMIGEAIPKGGRQ